MSSGTDARSQSVIDKREDARYPCVGIPLLYRQVNRDSSLPGFSQSSIHNISRMGMSFDVNKPLNVNDRIRILLNIDQHNIDQHNVDEHRVSDSCLAEVRWCKQLPGGNYRIGLKMIPDIEESKQPHHATGITDWDTHNLLNEVRDDSTDRLSLPDKVETLCPACSKRAIFSYVACQPILADKGIMPLYDCDQCHSTRSLQGILVPDT